MKINVSFLYRNENKELQTEFIEIEGKSKTDALKQAKDYAKTSGKRLSGWNEVKS